MTILTYFSSMFHLHISWRRQKTSCDIFRGYRNETLAWNRLKALNNNRIITCSRSVIKTSNQCVQLVPSKNKDNRTKLSYFWLLLGSIFSLLKLWILYLILCKYSPGNSPCYIINIFRIYIFIFAIRTKNETLFHKICA